MTWAAVGGAAVSIGGSYLLNQNSGSGSQSPGYVPKGIGGADQYWQNISGQNQSTLAGAGNGGLAQTINPAFYDSFQQSQGINYDPYLQASQQAGNQYRTLNTQAAMAGDRSWNQANQGFNQQQNLQNTGQQFYNQQQQLGGQAQMAGQAANAQQNGLAYGLQQAGQQVFNTGFDPQNQLYQRMMQQNQDQSGAINSMYGLGSSGAGAGMAQQSAQNFNIDWQNQQLQRQQAGLQSMQGANQAASGIANTGYNALANGLSQAGQFGQQGVQGLGSLNQAGIQAGNQGSANLQAGMGYYGQQPGYMQQSAQVPLNAQQYAAQQHGLNASTYAQQVGAGMQPYQSQQTALDTYMFGGAGAGSQAYQNQLAGNAQQTQQLNNLGQAVGNVNWGQLGSMFTTPNQSTFNNTNPIYSGSVSSGSDYNNIGP